MKKTKKVFDKKLEKAMKFDGLEELCEPCVAKLVKKIRDLRLLCKEFGFKDEVTLQLITSLVFNMETQIGYELAVREETT